MSVYEPFELMCRAFKDLVADGFTNDGEGDWHRNYEVGDWEITNHLALTGAIVTTLQKTSELRAYKEKRDQIERQNKENFEREFCRVNKLNYETETASRKRKSNVHIELEGFEIPAPFLDAWAPSERLIDEKLPGIFGMIRFDYNGTEKEQPKPRWKTPPRNDLPFPEPPAPIILNYLLPPNLTEEQISKLLLIQ